MITTLPDIEELTEVRNIWVSECPITFESFLELEDKRHIELIDGALVERTGASLEHESLSIWLITLLNGYVKHRKLGRVFGSRTAVPIDEFNGRLPDILFVRAENEGRMDQKAVRGGPDLVIELISPGDHPAHRISLETDYASIGVAEIVFIDQRRRNVTILRKRDAGYDRVVLSAGTLELETIPGFRIEVDWLFVEERPDEFKTLSNLLQ